MIDRSLYALFGAFLGAVVAAVALWFSADTINWLIVAAAAGVCAVLAFVWGEPVIEWIKEIWWWT